MSEFFEFLFGLAMLGLIILTIYSLFSAMLSKKPVRRKRSYGRKSSYGHRRGRGYGYYRTRPITSRTPRKYSGKSYVSNPDPNTFMVYFLENEKLGALKLGVGSWGRINEFIDARVTPSHSGERVGWKLLRAAKFSTSESEYDLGREQAYEAERRAHFYWRYVKRHPRHLEKTQMGFSLIEVYGQRKFEPTKGFTETAALGEVCEQSTWNYVLKSPGLKNEYIPKETRELKLLDSKSFELDVPIGYAEARIERIRHRADGSSTRIQISDEDRFWSKVEKTDSCWNWMASKTNNGYGQGYFGGSVRAAHRIVWTLEVGSDPGLFLMENNCGKRSCVNPHHWSISLRRRSLPGEVRTSEFNCTTEGCIRKARTMTRPGLCEPCRQVEKRARRRLRELNQDPET